MVKLTEDLKKLAQLFYDHNETLYIVGGYVRDGYLGVEDSNQSKDIDICSSASPEKVAYILSKSDFKFDYLNRELGVFVIIGEQRYDYATFRRENYMNNKHNPNSVMFIKSIKEDAERRDFRINAIYYDILNEEYVDPLGGLRDLDKKVITTTKIPRLVFNDDPERILRFIRFSQSLKLDIPDDEYYYAKANAENLQFLSRGRIRKEFEKIIYADKIYPEIGATTAHYDSVMMLEDFGVLDMIFPILSEVINSTETSCVSGSKFSDYVMDHFKNSSTELRLPIIFFDVLNQESSKHTDKKEKEFDKEKFINEIIDKNIGEEGLNFPKQEIDRIKKIVMGYYFEKTMFVTPKNVRHFIYNNYESFDGIIELKEKVKLSNQINEKEDKKRLQTIQVLKETYDEMKQENVLFDYTKLNITGKQLIKYFPRIKLDLLDEFMFEITGELSENSGMENTEENIVSMGKKVLLRKEEYFCEDEVEVATYKTDSKFKVFIKKIVRKVKRFFGFIFEKIKCIWIALFGKKKDKKSKDNKFENTKYIAPVIEPVFKADTEEII